MAAEPSPDVTAQAAPVPAADDRPNLRATRKKTAAAEDSTAVRPARRKATAKAAPSTIPDAEPPPRKRTARKAARTADAGPEPLPGMPAPARPTKAPTAGRKMTRPVADVGPANPSAKAKRTAARKAVQPPAPPLLTSLKYSPGYAPELLALAVVSRLGEQVRAQLAWLRETYPTATADGLARLGVRRYVREARRRGAVAGLAGSLAVLAEPTSLTWTQAKLVLHIATAYGQDPTDPRRAAELLVLQGVHEDVPAAEKAIERARRSGTATGIQEPGSRLAAPLTRFAGRGVLRVLLARTAARLLPGAAVVVNAVANADSTERLAARAVSRYRAGRP